MTGSLAPEPVPDLSVRSGNAETSQRRLSVERYGPDMERTRSLLPWLPPVVAGALGCAAVLAGWRGVDLPAQLYRVGLFHRDGLVLWDSQWYGGHWTFNYSVIFPLVAGVVGIQLTEVFSAALAALAFDRLVVGHFGARARLGSMLFAAGTLVPVAIGQLPFLLGECLALGACLAAARGRWLLGSALALATALASPLASGFLGLALVAWILATWPERRAGLMAMAGTALVPVLVAGALFPGQGPMPFPTWDFVQLGLLFGVLWVTIPRRERALRVGAALYALAIAATFVVASPVGGNISRLGETVGAPLAVCALWPRRRIFLAAAIVPLVGLQWTPAFGAFTTGRADPSREAAYFTPLLGFLAAHAVPAGRVEVVPTHGHWEAAYVAPEFPLARGWERQLDTADNPIFYGRGALTATAYTSWLRDNGVRYVALADAAPDYAARTEAQLLRAGVSGLSSPTPTGHWQVYEVSGSPGLVEGPARLVRIDGGTADLDIAAPGTVLVRVRYDSRWTVVEGHGCLRPTPSGWTEVAGAAPGPLLLRLHLVGTRDPACP
ncbi:MAG: hypothetical protein JWP02_766 [Acidimicrobiales bacterium]|nr:hypothetical protein [Acidimicrobiales bacterium]